MDKLESIRKRKFIQKPSPQDIVDVVSDFMGAWCLYCDIGQTIKLDIDITQLNIPCPKEVWDSCPILNKIKSYQKKKEDHHDSILPRDKDFNGSEPGFSD